jgi:pimeloyl-ACP methyl ester carboxylesterase
MKTLILIFALLVSITADVYCQMTEHITGALPAYRGQHAGTKVPYLLYTPLEIRNGETEKKYPVIIALHGIGERTDQYSTLASIGTGDLVDMYTTGIPTLLRTSTSTMSGDKFTPAGRPSSEATEFFVYAPQCWQGYSYFYPIYGDAMLDIIAQNPRADLNRIYLVGLSFGGGAVLTWLQIRDISDRIAGAVALCPGYSRFVWDSPQWSDYTNFANWGGLLLLGHSIDDATTQRPNSSLPISKTNPGSWHSDRAYDSIVNRYKGKTTVIYHRWETGLHNVWYRWQNPSNFSNVYPVDNGLSMGLGTSNNIYSLLLTRSLSQRRTD